MTVSGKLSGHQHASYSSKMFSTRFLLTILLSCVFIPEMPVLGQSAGQNNAAIDQAIYLSQLESNGNTSALYDEIHPDAQALVTEKTVSGWYESEFFPLEPQPISQIISIDFITWTWEVTGKSYSNTAEITFTQPFGSGPNPEVVTETVRLVEYQDGKWGWFFGRSKEFVDQQKAIYDPNGTAHRSTQQPATRTSRKSSTTETNNRASSNRSSNQRSPVSTQTCTLVELRPGYPGYRGLVTGLSQQWGGIGDWECLETLERNHPQFDRAEQDRLNSSTAKNLGINGEPEVWLWENWMAIEAEQGLPVQCYSCLLLDTSITPITTSIQQDWTDPRVQVGFMDSTSAVDIYLPTAQMRRNFDDNYQMRAHAFLVIGPSANAIDVLSIYKGLGQNEYWYSFSPGQYIYEVGGYSWVGPQAFPEDQIFSVFWAVYSGTYTFPAMIQESVISMLNGAIRNWQAELATGSSESFVEFLRRETAVLDY